MIEDIGRKIGKAQHKKPGLFLIMLAVVLLAALPGIIFLPANIEPSIEKLMPSQTIEVKLMNEMREQFGADMMYIVLTAQGPVEDVREKKSIEYIQLLSNRVLYNEHILQTRSIADGVADITDEHVLREQLTGNEFADDTYKTTYIEVRTDTGASATTIAQVIKQIQSDIDITSDKNPGFTVKITGFGTIDKATFDIIISDFTKITGLSFVLMLGFLYFYFKRNLTKTFVSVSIIMISLIITMGITGYLQFIITVMTMVAAAMIMALGISYGIHITHTYYELRKKHGKKQTMQELQQNLIRALLGSSLTTSAGFLALLFGVLPAMKTLGIVLAIGIIITLTAGIFFLPPILLLTDKRRKKK